MNAITIRANPLNLEDLKQIVEELDDNRDYLKEMHRYVSGWQVVDQGRIRKIKTFRALTNMEMLVGVIEFDRLDQDSEVKITIKVI